MDIIIREDCEKIIKNINLNPLRNKRALLTGANGFLGQYIVHVIYLANRLKKLNCRLHCISLHRPNRFLSELLAERLMSFERRDLSKPFRIKGKFDYIFHAACYGQPAKFIENPFATAYLNTEAARTLLDLTRHSRGVFVFFGSAEVYGDVPKGMRAIPESFPGIYPTLGLRSIYGESKRLGESICFFFREQYGVEAKIVRISHLYGPGISIHDKRVLGDFIRGALRDGRIRLLDRGKAVKTYGYIADAIQMILQVALHGRDVVYNVGGRDSISIRELARLVGEYCDVSVTVPRSSSRLPHVGGDPQFVRPDLSKIMKAMKKFHFTPLSVGLRRTIEWNKKEFKI